LKIEELEKGDLIVVRWSDASDTRATLEEHRGNPETPCKDWGVYLGVTGVHRRFLLLGKDVVEANNEWGATRIPLELVEETTLMLPKDAVQKSIREILTLSRRVTLRRARRRGLVVRVA
jgi:hypothetical protein